MARKGFRALRVLALGCRAFGFRVEGSGVPCWFQGGQSLKSRPNHSRWVQKESLVTVFVRDMGRFSMKFLAAKLEN